MTNLKTSQLNYASLPLTGDEIVGIVQEGLNVQTTSLAISKSAFDYTDKVIVGKLAVCLGSYGVAVGYDANVSAMGGTAIGAYSSANAHRSMAIGYQARSGGYESISMGTNTHTYDYSSMAIGAFTYVYNSSSIGIGVSNKISNTYAIAIGSRIVTNQPGSVAIGYETKVTGPYGIAIGQKAFCVGGAGIAFGYQAYSYAVGIAIGYKATTGTNGYAIAIGPNATVNGKGGVVVGSNSFADQYAVAFGRGAIAHAYGAVNIGTYTYVAQQNGVALGTRSISAGANSVAIGGAHATNANSICLGENAQDQTIGSFVVAGAVTDALLSPLDHYQKFVGTTSTGTTTTVLTADGDSYTSGNNNTVGMAVTSIAAITGRVTGIGGQFFASSDNAATFVLSNSFVYRATSGTYTIIGTPTFTLENHTSGASGWAVPTLSVDGGTGKLIVTVTNGTSSTTNWTAHFKLETSN